jgi:hypothetical protein
MKRAFAWSAIAAGLMGWLVWLALPGVCLAAASPRAGQAGARGAGAATGAPVSPPAGPAAPAAAADQATVAAAAPLPAGAWFLSATQEQQLRRIGRAAHRWRAALAPLAAAAQEQGDAALQGELLQVDLLLRQLESARQMTFAAYVAVLAARNQALALWAASSADVGPAEAVAWQQADAGAAELATAADTGFVFGADLASGATWTYAERPPGEGGTTGGAGMSPDSESGASGDAVSGDAGAMPDAAVAATLADPGAGAAEIPVPEADPGAPVPAAAMAALGSEGVAPGAADQDAGADGATAAPALGGDPQTLPAADLSQPGDTSSGLVWEEICRPRPSAPGRHALCPLQPAGAE